jgi:hypothetical protein
VSETPLRALLGHEEEDPGCEGAFEVFDAYCDAVSRGEPLDARWAGFLSHLANCAACREDAEGLLAALREEPQVGDPG